jgi:sugar phosphate isomerase/epimerase
MRWPLGYVVLDSVIETWPTEKVIDAMESLGFAGVDWSSLHFDPLTQPASDFVELVAKTRERGLEVPQLLVPTDFITPNDARREELLQRVLAGIDAAQQAGVRSVGLTTGPHPWTSEALVVGRDVEEAQAWEWASFAMARIVERAQERNVLVGLEPVWGSIVDNAPALQRMLESTPGLGINFDPSHLVLSGDDIPMWIRTWKGKIVHVHLKDCFGSRGMDGVTFFFPLLGEGLVPWEGVLEALSDIDYQGFASIEAESYRLLSQGYGGDPTGPAALALSLANSLYDLAGLK